MGIEETGGSQGSGAEGSPIGDPSGRSGLGKSARVVILVVVLGGLLLVGMIVSARRRDDYDHQKTSVQIEALAAGESIDVDAFRAAWAEELTGEWAGGEVRPARALIPEVRGADLSNYFVVMAPNPTQVIIDFQFEAGGQNGCVRVVRGSEGTTVSSGDDLCVRAFSTGAAN